MLGTALTKDNAMLYHEWVRLRKFVAFKDFDKDSFARDVGENLDGEYCFGIFHYGDTGFLEENRADVRNSMGVPIKRYTCCFYNDEFSSDELHLVERYLYDNIVDEGGFAEPDLGIDPQLG
jgi:hypothetical protein